MHCRCHPAACRTPCCCCRQFDALQTCSGPETPLRRPPCNTLLDVFTNIRDDEIEHVKTMHACQDTKRIAADLAAARRKNAAGGNGNGTHSSTGLGL